MKINGKLILSYRLYNSWFIISTSLIIDKNIKFFDKKSTHICHKEILLNLSKPKSTMKINDNKVDYKTNYKTWIQDAVCSMNDLEISFQKLKFSLNDYSSKLLGIIFSKFCPVPPKIIYKFTIGKYVDIKKGKHLYNIHI